MSPREPYGDEAMSSAERVRRSRWVNNLENTAYKLLELINEAPEKLPRSPSIPAELIDKLRPFTNTDKTIETQVASPSVRVLKLGNGNQELLGFEPEPVNVVGLDGQLVAIAAGEEHTCAVDDPGNVWCWGANHFGQIGNGERSAIPR